MRTLIFAILIVGAVPLSADGRGECGDLAESRLFAANTWMDLAHWSHAHPHCLDGSLAAHFGSQIGEWLSQDRPAFTRLHAAIAAHPEFEPLVNWYLGGESLSVEELKTIHQNADRECPVEAANVCAAIRRSVRANLEDIASKN